jgi:hypothetical protein
MVAEGVHRRRAEQGFRRGEPEGCPRATRSVVCRGDGRHARQAGHIRECPFPDMRANDTQQWVGSRPRRAGFSARVARHKREQPPDGRVHTPRRDVPVADAVPIRRRSAAALTPAFVTQRARVRRHGHARLGRHANVWPGARRALVRDDVQACRSRLASSTVGGRRACRSSRGPRGDAGNIGRGHWPRVSGSLADRWSG